MKQRALCDLLDDLRFEVHHYLVQVNTLDPPSWQTCLRQFVKIGESSEKLEREVFDAAVGAARTFPGAKVRIVLELYGQSRARTLEVVPA